MLFLNLVQQFSDFTRGFDRQADFERTRSNVWPVHPFDFDYNKRGDRQDLMEELSIEKMLVDATTFGCARASVAVASTSKTT